MEIEVIEDGLRIDFGACIGQFVSMLGKQYLVTDLAITETANCKAVNGKIGAIMRPADCYSKIALDCQGRIYPSTDKSRCPCGNPAMFPGNVLQLLVFELMAPRTIIQVRGGGGHSGSIGDHAG